MAKLDLNVESKVRMSRRFSWACVDRSLLRAMLEEAYAVAGRDEDVQRVRQLSEDALVRQATSTLGRTPRHDRVANVIDVLRRRWLPALSRQDLDELAYVVQMGLSGPEKTAVFRTKADLLDFFWRRNATDTFVHNVRAAFVRLHKESVPVRHGTAGQPGRLVGEVLLEGQSLADRREPFAHQKEAWENLEALTRAVKPEQRSGLVVLPTGAGKTFTMVAWLMRQLAANPDLRVLWIADQQELLDQAGRSFEEQAPTMAANTIRRLRVIHGAANQASALGDKHLDVACITRQSLLGQSFNESARKRLKSFLQRPCVVVVDEAHHAVAPTYQRALSFIRATSPQALIVGLTATPWPSGFGMTARLHDMFPCRVSDVRVRDLVLNGTLARPIFHTVDTGESISLSSDELKAVAGRDLPSSVLRRLDRHRRNEVIVDAWRDRQVDWGKTLVFACDIEHAEHLSSAFTDGGVPNTVVHSRSEARREDVLAEFRQTRGPAVLISVGMLLEGVDVPDARTAFLTRPTKSRLLMRQMIGRVLRGPAGGGEEYAHVVDLRDRWTDDIDILAPVEVPGIPSIRTEAEDDRKLPPVIDELSGEPLGEDVLRRVEKAYRDIVAAVPHSAALHSTELIGYYDLDHLHVPVFDHVKDRWDELISSIVSKGPASANSSLQLFDDLSAPRPPREDIQEVVAYCRSRQFEPPLVAVSSRFNLRYAARELIDAGPLTEPQKLDRLRNVYESTLARSQYFSLQHFIEAVQQELLSLAGVTGNLADPENPPGAGVDGASGLPKISRRSDRELEPLFRSAVRQGRELLEAEEAIYVELLRRPNLPRVGWTRRDVKRTWAYWTTRLAGSRRGIPEVRVNRRLQAPRTQVSDELLEYLIWHELCHHVLPGRGHDAEFRRLESLWPDFTALDHELDTLHERFDLGW